MLKTKNKWYTKKCGRCGNTHIGYTGKLDQYGVEYVVCEITNQKMYINNLGRSRIYNTEWLKHKKGE